MKNENVYCGCIYLFTNLVTNQVYIGQTSNPKQRYRQHLNPANISTWIDRAINEYGIDNFSYEELVHIQKPSYQEYKKAIDELGTFYMNKYRQLGYQLYNQTEKGGGHTWASYNQHREYGPLSDEHRQKIKQSLKKYYETHKCRDMSRGNNPTAKRVIGIDVNSEEIVESYACGKTACEKIGMNYSTFKQKMKKGGVLIDNILYTYETTTKETL